MNLNIPSFGQYEIKNIVFDYNGTIACSGQAIVTANNLKKLTSRFNVYILTGNTFNKIEHISDDVQLMITQTAEDKLKAIKKIGPQETIAVGNGNIDHLMLKAAAIGVAVIGQEGCSTKAILNADMVINDIKDFFELVDQPKKIIATLKA